MATNGKSTRSNGASGGINSQVVLDQAELLAGSASIVARVSEEVSEGAGTQLAAIESALTGLNEMSASLKETAGQAESVAVSAEELASSVN